MDSLPNTTLLAAGQPANIQGLSVVGIVQRSTERYRNVAGPEEW